MTLLRLSARQFRRGWKSGEYGVMAAALALALAAVSAVGFFTGRVRTAVVQQAGESLAADLVLASGEPLPPRFEQEARAAGALTVPVLDFNTVLLNGQDTQLVGVHAVSAGYPLRGKVRLSQQAFGAARTTEDIPAHGVLWAEPRVLGSLRLAVGDVITVGNIKMRVGAATAYLPDGGFGFAALEPKVVMDLADVPATGLVNAYSRVEHKLLVSGDQDTVAALEARWRTALPAGVRLQDARDGRPELVNAIDRAQRFLALAALVSALISAVAVVLAARRYALRYTDTAAVLKCLGLTRRRVQGVLLLELLWLGLSAGLAGVALGYLAQYGLVAAVRDLLPAQMPPAPVTPALAALGMGLVLLLGFALPPLMRLGDTPPARVLRRDLAPPPVRGFAVYGAAVAASFGITLWQVKTLGLALAVLLGLALTVLLLGLGAFGMLFLLKRLRRGGGAGWRYGLANLNRHRRDTVIQMVAFGIGLMVLLLLALVRADLLSSWRTSLPDDAPNQFIINIQPDERATVTKFFTDRGVPAPRLYPFVRARLSDIAGKPVTGMRFETEDARRFAQREQNLSWSYDPPPANTLTAGKWWEGTQAKQPLASVTEEFATSLKLKPGDRLTFDVAGTPVAVTVASIRKVRWDSFQPNFFVELSPGALEDHPGTWITSVYLPAEKAAMLADLIRALPSLTLFDVDAIMQQVRRLMDEASLAVEYVFLFTLGAGIVVLLAAVQATRDERRFEAAVLRALGASRRRVSSAAAAEYAALGFTAGLLGALAATLVAWILAVRIFSLPYAPDWRVWAAGLLAGTFIVALSGLLATRGVLKAPPVETLRDS
ncbi:MAG TPA: FtsX-like permease family protein [Gammaproteobacteria bacterium]